MEENDFEDPTTFESQEAELEYWRNAAYNARELYIDAQIEIESVQKQIGELSTEYENDINLLEKANTEMRNEIQRLKSSVEDWREKYKKERLNVEETYTKTERELEFLKSQQEYYKSRTRELEQDNDDLEKSERAIKSSLVDAETKMKRLSQTNESLLIEVKSKNQLVEEVQRLKDELNDLTTELSIVRRQKPETQASKIQLGRQLARSMNAASNETSWNEVMERMKGLESRIENARSLVSPLIHPSRRYGSLNKTAFNESLQATKESSGIRPLKPGVMRSATVYLSPEKTINSGLREPIQTSTDLPKPSTLGRSNFTASSESSRLRMAKSRALRNEMRRQFLANQEPDDQQKVPL